MLSSNRVNFGIFTCSIIVYRNENERPTMYIPAVWILNSRDESHKHSTERKKSERAFSILYGSVYVKCKIRQNLSCWKSM